jgi:hypothetical protein
MTSADAELKLSAFVPLLLENFPRAAFTQASLHYVGSQCKFFPSYAEVITHLRAWWRENRPIDNALPAPLRREPEPERPEPTEEERAYVRRRVAEITAILSDDAAELARPLPGPRHLTPEQLDIVNPLPNGRKRHAPERDESVPPPSGPDTAA